jgi:NAD(P)-dependent dehydrogenase (short-subunit alcohol dehydrogenase family)
MTRFADKVVLVTGASTGIGLETIVRIQDAGGLVYGAHRRKETEMDLRGARPVYLDVTDELEWGTAIEQIIAQEWASGRAD